MSNTIYILYLIYYILYIIFYKDILQINIQNIFEKYFLLCSNYCVLTLIFLYRLFIELGELVELVLFFFDVKLE